MAVDQVLVALHLDWAVAADILVPITRVRIVEHIDSQVENSIALRRVSQNGLIHWTLIELALEVFRRNEVTVIKIAFADREHVQKHQCGDGRGCDISPLTDVGIIAGNVFRFAVRPHNQDIGSHYKEE